MCTELTCTHKPLCKYDENSNKTDFLIYLYKSILCQIKFWYLPFIFDITHRRFEFRQLKLLLNANSSAKHFDVSSYCFWRFSVSRLSNNSGSKSINVRLWMSEMCIEFAMKYNKSCMFNVCVGYCEQEAPLGSVLTPANTPWTMLVYMIFPFFASENMYTPVSFSFVGGFCWKFE